MRVTGSNIRFVFMDPANEIVVSSRWLMMIAPLMGISDITLRRHFQNEDGTIASKYERDGCVVYRLEEHKEKKIKGNSFIHATLKSRNIIKNIYHATVRQPKKRNY